MLDLMRTVLAVLSCVTVTVCAQHLPVVERSIELGFGFRRDVIAEQNPPNSFESIGHFESLFYRSQKLAKLDDCLVSPSGDAIVYQEATSGNIFVFNRRDDTTIQLTKTFPGLANKFVWHEREGVVEAFGVPSSTSTQSGKWIQLQIHGSNKALQPTAQTASFLLCLPYLGHMNSQPLALS